MKLSKFVAGFILSGSIEEHPSKRVFIVLTDRDQGTEYPLGGDVTVEEMGIDPCYEAIATLGNLYSAGIKSVKVSTVTTEHTTRYLICPVMTGFDPKMYTEYMSDYLLTQANYLYPEFESLIIEPYLSALPDDCEDDRYVPAVKVSAFRAIARAVGMEVVLCSQINFEGNYSGYVFRVALYADNL